ncbi:MATE family efflux transporter [Corallincola luteus]|uniref:MATE family efflux transporter n=2 Tax=Corallincola luteus TaxID=1775177 RepID=A0ABY2AMP3_9GAMM|nr:MATE family efflux transporter [Corallincola luteus]TCI03920.1 MATE family efflux transporter [Corallincola luteus]
MPAAKFVHGSIFRHIVVMSSTNAIGLTALFLVDLADLFFISLLGEQELAAAVGYAGSILFFTTSVGIGLSIAMTALVSKAIGEKDREKACHLVTNVLVAGFAICVVVAALVWMYTPDLLHLMGATGRTHALAVDYLQILLPSLPILGLAICGGAALRSVGDAKLAMWSTLAGGATNAVLDPIFIFALGLGLEGVAYASVMARLVLAIVALVGVFNKHRLFARFDFISMQSQLAAILSVAFPAILTNIATPIGNAFVTASIAKYGDGYVAGWAVIGRLIPVAFGMIYSLSGAVGPIIGQNYGALNFDRIEQALRNAMGFCFAYVLTVCLLIYFARNGLVSAFGLSGDSADFLVFFCTWVSISFAFNGALFVSNAAFNNLGYPSLSTLMNVSKASIGTIPLVLVGSYYWGAEGVLIGQMSGSVVFGIAGLAWALAKVKKMAIRHQQQISPSEALVSPAMPMTPFCSSRAYMCAEAEVADEEVCAQADVK